MCRYHLLDSFVVVGFITRWTLVLMEVEMSFEQQILRKNEMIQWF